MPDLGKYASEVLSAYGVSIVLIAALVVLSLWQSKRTKAELARIDARLRRAEAEGQNDA